MDWKDSFICFPNRDLVRFPINRRDHVEMRKTTAIGSLENSHSRRELATISKLEMSLDHIFGPGTSRPLEFNNLDFEYSPRTGRVRHVRERSSGTLLFTFRHDGSIAPSIAGAKALLDRKTMKALKKNSKGNYTRPRWTVTVMDGVSEIVSQGKTVFCKHVVDCHHSLRPVEDVAVLNQKGELLAVGRTILAGPIMKQFKRGVAVKVREGRQSIS